MEADATLEVEQMAEGKRSVSSSHLWDPYTLSHLRSKAENNKDKYKYVTHG